MSLTTEAATTIEQYFTRHGRRRRRLARLYGSTVKFLVAQHGIEALDRIEVDLQCACCDEEQARAERLSWMKSKYRQPRQ